MQTILSVDPGRLDTETTQAAPLRCLHQMVEVPARETI